MVADALFQMSVVVLEEVENVSLVHDDAWVLQVMKAGVVVVHRCMLVQWVSTEVAEVDDQSRSVQID